ncbi:MAG: sigma-70 family RNA polymerase sigma factor [Pseudomonadales bacterium]
MTTVKQAVNDSNTRSHDSTGGFTVPSVTLYIGHLIHELSQNHRFLTHEEDTELGYLMLRGRSHLIRSWSALPSVVIPFLLDVEQALVVGKSLRTMVSLIHSRNGRWIRLEKNNREVFDATTANEVRIALNLSKDIGKHAPGSVASESAHALFSEQCARIIPHYSVIPEIDKGFLTASDKIKRAYDEFCSLLTNSLGIPEVMATDIALSCNTMPRFKKRLGRIAGPVLDRTDTWSAMMEGIKTFWHKLGCFELASGESPRFLLYMISYYNEGKATIAGVISAFSIANQGLVHQVANGYLQYANCPDELAQAGQTGLMRAAYRYAPEMGFRFTSLAKQWIREEVSKETRSNKNFIPLDDLMDDVEDEHCPVSDIEDKQSLATIVKVLKKYLSEQEASLLIRNYGLFQEKASYVQLAKENDISDTRVKQICKIAMQKIRQSPAAEQLAIILEGSLS